MPDNPAIYRKTAILQKNGIFAAVGVYSYLNELHAVASFDPRCAKGTPGRVGLLRGAGNAINARQATVFIKSWLEVEGNIA